MKTKKSPLIRCKDVPKTNSNSSAKCQEQIPKAAFQEPRPMLSFRAQVDPRPLYGVKVAVILSASLSP